MNFIKDTIKRIAEFLKNLFFPKSKEEPIPPEDFYPLF